MLKKAHELIKDEGEVNHKVRKAFSKWVKANTDLTGGDKAYKYIDEEKQVYQSVSLRAPEPRIDEKFFKPLIHPITKKSCSVPPNGFSRRPETIKEMMDNGEILFGIDETTQPRQKVTLNSEVKKQMPSILQDAKKGKGELKAMGLNFPYNHSSSLYEKLIGTSIGGINGNVLDFFAGSATSGHSVLNINRIGNRSVKYFLVEMGNYFPAITKPRIQKVIHSSRWKAAKPQNSNGSKNHIFKYFTLEQYEDVLDAVANEEEQLKIRKDLEKIGTEKLVEIPLKYLYKPELTN